MSKILNRSIILTILGIITASCFGSWVLSRSKSTSSPGTYTNADRVSRPEEVARVIHEHVKVSDDFPIAKISQQLVAIELASGGTTFTISLKPVVGLDVSMSQWIGKIGNRSPYNWSIYPIASLYSPVSPRLAA
jgi:hypothetical protein